jgi:hypothetical protein
MAFRFWVPLLVVVAGVVVVPFGVVDGVVTGGVVDPPEFAFGAAEEEHAATANVTATAMVPMTRIDLGGLALPPDILFLLLSISA